MTGLLRDFMSGPLYLDTMIPYALLRGIEPDAVALFQRIQKGEIEAYTSVLTFDELAYRLLLALVKDNYSGSPIEKLRDDEKNILREFYPIISPQLERFAKFPNITVLGVDRSDITEMNEIILYIP